MATCVDDIKLFCEALFGHNAYDVFPLKYRKIDESKKIIFGYTKRYPFMHVSPICNRAVMETVDKLRASGQSVVEYELPASFDRLATAFYDLMSSDDYKFYFDKLRNEEREPILRKLLAYASMPSWIKYITAWIAGLVLKDKRAVGIIKAICKKDAYQLHKIQMEIEQINSEFSKSIEDSGIDVLIMPVHVLPATPNGSFGDIHFCAAHTFMWNLLNLPIGAMPAVNFDSSKDIIKGNWPRKFKFSDVFDNNLLEKASQNWYNPERIANIPAGIQIIGKCNQDETVIEAMSLIEKSKTV